MRFCADAGVPLAPQVASRVIRHLYGSDIHWEAELEPGIVIVHGMGLAVSRAARVRRGAILFQHVTLGLGVDPKSRAVGGLPSSATRTSALAVHWSVPSRWGLAPRSPRIASCVTRFRRTLSSKPRRPRCPRASVEATAYALQQAAERSFARSQSGCSIRPPRGPRDAAETRPPPPSLRITAWYVKRTR